jgi:hypothetical protein
MPQYANECSDDLSAAIAQYLLTADEVLSRVDDLLYSEFNSTREVTVTLKA